MVRKLPIYIYALLPVKKLFVDTVSDFFRPAQVKKFINTLPEITCKFCHQHQVTVVKCIDHSVYFDHVVTVPLPFRGSKLPPGVLLGGRPVDNVAYPLFCICEAQSGHYFISCITRTDEAIFPCQTDKCLMFQLLIIPADRFSVSGVHKVIVEH